MVKITTDMKGKPLPCELYLDGYIYSVLKDAQSYVDNNFDNIGFVCGGEGNGKTAFAMTVALALDADFDLEKVVFTADQFEEAVDNAEDGSAIVWDEADELAGHWADSTVNAVKRKLKRIRKQNLHIILVTPTFWDINKYFAISRTRWLANVYSDFVTRGNLRFFNSDRKKLLYIKGKREWDWNAAKPNFLASFTKLPEDFPFSIESDSAYDDKKDAATKAIREVEGVTTKEALRIYRRKCLLNFIRWYSERHEKEPSQRDSAFVFDVSQPTIHRDMEEVDYS